MNFALTSLKEAFSDVVYQRENSNFKLFGFLLATQADRNVIPEVLFISMKYTKRLVSMCS